MRQPLPPGRTVPIKGKPTGWEGWTPTLAPMIDLGPALAIVADIAVDVAAMFQRLGIILTDWQRTFVATMLERDSQGDFVLRSGRGQ